MMNLPSKPTPQTGKIRLETFKSLSGTTLIFGGTFDPVHNGHIEAAMRVKEASGATNVVLVPTHQNPLKPKGPIASDADRLELLELAVANRPGFYVSGIECRPGGPAFTIETMRQIKAQAPTLPLQLLIGADQLSSLHRWQEYDALLSVVEVWVVGRDAVQGAEMIASCENLTPQIRAQLQKRFVPLAIDVSSTAIRAALAAGGSELKTAHGQKFLDPAVTARIEERGLYGIAIT